MQISTALLSQMAAYLTKCDFRGGASGKELACQWRRHKRYRFNPWVEKIPWRQKWKPTAVFLPGKSHGKGPL